MDLCVEGWRKAVSRLLMTSGCLGQHPLSPLSSWKRESWPSPASWGVQIGSVFFPPTETVSWCSCPVPASTAPAPGVMARACPFSAVILSLANTTNPDPSQEHKIFKMCIYLTQSPSWHFRMEGEHKKKEAATFPLF